MNNMQTVISGILLASTGLIAPGSSLAEDVFCEGETESLCQKNKVKQTVKANSPQLLLLTSSYTPTGSAGDAVINAGNNAILSGRDADLVLVYSFVF